MKFFAVRRLPLAGLMSCWIGSASILLAGPCPEPNLNAAGRYSVGGYFVLGDYDDCGWQTVLEQIHRVGADTVVQFAPAIKLSTPTDIVKDGVFSRCVDAGQACVAQAEKEVNALPGNHQIEKIFTYVSNSVADKRLLASPPLEKKIDPGGDYVYWRLLFPVGAERTPPLEATEKAKFYLVLVAAHRYDSLGSLLRKADVFDKKVYVGIPIFPSHPLYSWAPDTNLFPLAGAFTERVFMDLNDRFSTNRSWAGLYQSFEISVGSNPLASTLDLYQYEHRIAKNVLGDKKILVSPYWSSFLGSPNFATPKDVTTGIRKIAETGVDIVAPQDGGGTGKVGRYSDGERNATVEPRLQKVVRGMKTYAESYGASTADFYSAGKTGIDQARFITGRPIEYWANVEAFDPDPPDLKEACGAQTRSRTEKASLDKGIQLAEPRVEKIISFMWSSYYTCKGGQSESLSDEIVRTINSAPIVTIVAPLPRSTFTAPQTVSVTANASDNVGVTKVWFIRNSVVVSTDTTAPYSYDWPVTATDNGSYNWSATAFDGMGNSSTTVLVPVTVNIDATKPNIAITAPSAGATFTVPQTVPITASASDNVGVTKVWFLLDGVVVSTATAAPYETRWWVRGVANGTHTWVARAFDTVGNSGDSAPVAIKVNIPALPAAYADDFNSDTTGALPLGWTCVTGPTASVAVDETVYRGATGKSIYLQDSSSTTYSQIQHTNSPMDTVYYKASVRFKDKNQLSYVFLGNGNKTSLWFLTAYSGQWARSDATKTTRLPGDTTGYEANQWYDVEVEADFSKGTYGVWVDGVSIGQEIPIPGGNSYMTGFRILPAGTPGTGEMWVDDIYYAPQRPAVDLIAPRISEIKAQEVTDHSAAIVWTTNEDSDSRVHWGTTDQVSSGTLVDAGFVTSHRLVLGALDRSTTYYYQVESMDKSGNLRSSGLQSLVTPYDTTPPIVAVTTPTAGIVVSVPGPVKVGATATDLSSVSKVQFLLDGIVVSTATAAPYETSWWARGVANGTHTWVARAFDTVGNGGDSAPVAIKVNIPALPAAYTDDFNSDATGAVPAGWTCVTGPTAKVAVDETIHRGTKGKSVYLQDSSSTTYSQIQHTNSPMDTVYYKASVRFKDKNQVSYVFLGNGNKTSLWFLTAYSGRWAGGDETKTTRLPGDTAGYEANRWYDVEVEADFSKGTYGVWVDGVSIGQDIPIPGGNSYMTGFRILPAGTPGAGNMWIDDIYYAPQRPSILAGAPTTDLQNPPGQSPPDEIRAYPNPCKISLGESGITIDGLGEGYSVKIFTISGLRVKTISAPPSGKSIWDLSNDNGRTVASGVYFALVEGSGTHKRLKLVVQR